MHAYLNTTQEAYAIRDTWLAEHDCSPGHGGDNWFDLYFDCMDSADLQALRTHASMDTGPRVYILKTRDRLAAASFACRTTTNPLAAFIFVQLSHQQASAEQLKADLEKEEAARRVEIREAENLAWVKRRQDLEL
jgi:hypothetical protein